MKDYENISNSELIGIIDEWIRGERDRKIMKRRIIDRICYEALASEFGLSDRHVRKICAKHEAVITKVVDNKSEITVPRFYCQTS